MKQGVKLQQPAERLDYDFDFTGWFGDNGDQIDWVTDPPTVTCTPEGLELMVMQVSETVAKVWVSGGEDGTTYSIELTIHTTNGRVKQDELEIAVVEIT